MVATVARDFSADWLMRILTGVDLVEAIPVIFDGRGVQMASRVAAIIHHFLGGIGNRISSAIFPSLQDDVS
ncbi:hypothetical protein MTR67_042871 [Solanum verrucosum]|uniref:Uncharacterized protein n=1 Tax=Solanum verrucosum TaxID=315347 RepID=A0AAF0ZS60_SOLVR|nr:hypothetical protein MTR67_042871 [Solanum verrucosum]